MMPSIVFVLLITHVDIHEYNKTPPTAALSRMTSRLFRPISKNQDALECQQLYPEVEIWNEISIHWLTINKLFQIQISVNLWVWHEMSFNLISTPVYYLDRYTCNQGCFSVGTRGDAVPTLFWSLFWWGNAFPHTASGRKKKQGCDSSCFCRISGRASLWAITTLKKAFPHFLKWKSTPACNVFSMLRDFKNVEVSF